MSNKNRLLVPQSKPALEQLKYETAQELGVLNQYSQNYQGDIPSKISGSVGGRVGGGMVKKMIQAYEESVSKK